MRIDFSKNVDYVQNYNKTMEDVVKTVTILRIYSNRCGRDDRKEIRR